MNNTQSIQPPRVVFCGTHSLDDKPRQPKKWRIRVWDQDRNEERATFVGFERERDAKAALAALVAAGYSTHEAILAMDPNERRRIMCEALAW